ncbi:MAG: hypothetical protein NE334_07340 [Lentisphaeraceae bacterium]|nr:hypothetical protein [Lentisphaeraceae bacterium]
MKSLLKINAFIFLLLTILFTGCSSNPESSANILEDTEFTIKDSTKFMNEFREIEDSLSTKIEETFLEVLTSSNNREVQKNVIRIRQFVTGRLRNLEETDPRLVTLYAWSFFRRLHEYTTNGDGRFLFGKSQEILSKSLKEIDTTFYLFTTKYLEPETLNEVSSKINKYVESTPIIGVFEDKEKSAGAFSDMLDIPLTPFRALGAVNKGGQGIADIAVTANRFTDIVEDLPEDLRWQLQVLTLQLQDNKILKENTKTLKSLATSFEKMNKSMETYPKFWQEERKLLFAETNKVMVQLETISKSINDSTKNIKASSQNFSNLGKDIDSSATKITSSLKQVDASSQSLTKAANAVSQTISNIQKISEYFKSNSSDDEKNKDSPDFLVQVEKSAAALGKSAHEISEALKQIQTLSNDKPFSDQISSIDQVSQKTLALTRSESEALVDYIFIRALILIGLVFLAGLILALVKKKKAATKNA